MGKIRAVVGTDSASRYLQQLCKHWSHRFEVDFNPERGTIALPMGRVDLVASDKALTVECLVDSEEQTENMQRVVAAHINRFAFREGELVFHWETLDAG